MPKIKIHNAETNQIIEREMTADEKKQLEQDRLAELQSKAETEAKAAAKSQLLEKLGITEDEAKLLLA